MLIRVRAQPRHLRLQIAARVLRRLQLPFQISDLTERLLQLHAHLFKLRAQLAARLDESR